MATKLLLDPWAAEQKCVQFSHSVVSDFATLLTAAH